MTAISITRALVMLKTLDKRLVNLTDEFKPLDIVVDKKLVLSKQPREEFEKLIREKYQQLVDLIRQRERIKSGIVKSNAEKLVKIAGIEMSVAQAIERKSSIGFEEALLNTLKSRFADINHIVDSSNSTVSNRLDKLLESTFSKESTKVKPEEYDAVAKPFLERNQAAIVDPLDVRKKIDELSQSISSFQEEVDVVLSESNAVTYIDV
jgi:hypothetical protein